MKKKWQVDALQLLSRYRAAMMGLAAILIVIMHCWLVIVPNRPILGAIEGLIKWNAVLGLDMFFFYSGLGQTYAIRKNALRQYYFHRLRRLLIPFWIMALAYGYTEGWGFGKLVRNSLGISFFTETIFAHLWFVPAILLVYLIFPLYHRMMMRSGSKMAFSLCTVCVWLCATILLRDVMREDVWFFNNRLPGFMLGVFVGELGREKQIRMTGTHWMLCLLIMAVGWLLRDAASHALIQLTPQFYLVPAALIAVALCFLFSGLFAVLESCGGLIGKATGLLLQLLCFVGNFTLELYCIHQWLYGILNGALEGHVSYLAINVIVLPVLIFAGWLLYCVHMRLLSVVDRFVFRKR